MCLTGQHREMLHQVMDLFGIEADYDLDIMTPGQSLTDVTCAVLGGLGPILALERPDWVLVQGDTTTAMAGSLAAFYHNVRVGHVEAGLRTGDNASPYPEEVNRRMTAVLADVHFAPTQWAADNLLREGIPADQIFITGNTVIDAFHQAAQIPLSDVNPLSELPSKRRLVLATVHRRENFGQRLEDICFALKTLAFRHTDIEIVFPVHPNPHVREPVHRILGDVPNVSLLAPLDYHPLVRLMGRAHLLITDSGGIQEEATGVGKPVLILRDTTERPEGVQAGSARLVGANMADLLHWGSKLLTDDKAYADMATTTSPYGSGYAAYEISRILKAIAHGGGPAMDGHDLDAEAIDDGELAIGAAAARDVA